MNTQENQAVQVGMIVEGRVTGITAFGAFVALAGGKSGMIHISEISTGFVKEVRDHLQEEQIVKVKVIGIDERGRIALSIKQILLEERAKRQAEKPVKSNDAPAEYVSSARKTAETGDSFEDMMARFKSESDEKISDLKKSVMSKRSGFSRKNSGNGKF